VEVVPVTPDAVTVVGPIPARMVGAGRSTAQRFGFEFEFELLELANGAERGTLTLQATRSRGRADARRGDKFVLTGLDEIVFTDEPGIEAPERLRVTVDTAAFTGVGDWNGQSGYTFEARASDAGTPGAGRDLFSLTIRSPEGRTVVALSGPISEGNIELLRPRSRRLRH
jgi:hypothetical protein